MKSKKEKTRVIVQQFWTKPNYCLLLVTAILCVFGLMMVYSASAYSCAVEEKYGFDAAYYLKREAIYTILGGLFLLITWKLDYGLIKNMTLLIYGASFILIFLLKTPLGVKVNGATRWLNVGPISIQVADIIKIAVILALSWFSVKYYYRVRKKLKYWSLLWAVGMIPAVLLAVISSNLSSLIILGAISFGMILVVSRKFLWHAGLVFGALLLFIGICLYVKNDMPSSVEADQGDFRLARIAVWMDPERYEKGKGYQTVQSLYAVGLGGVNGKGLGNGIQKLTRIPESQNDMIFAVICEELGIVGALFVIVLFALLLAILFYMLMYCKDVYGGALIAGVFFHIGIQVFLNIAVVLNAVPNTGVSLPFISYGGSAIITTLIEIGLVLSVYDHHIKANYEKMKAEEYEERKKRRKPSYE